MGKRTPTPPTPPDPNVVSAAQTRSNEDTAQFQSQLNNANSVGPYGNVTLTQDPTSHQWTQTTQLSPSQQGLYDASTATELGALGIANHQLGNVANALNTPLTPNQVATGVNPGQLQTGFGQNLPGVQYGFGQGQPIQGSVGQNTLQYGFDNPAVQGQVGLQSTFGGAGGIQGGVGSGGQIQGGVGQGAPLQLGFNQGQGVQGHVNGGGPIQSNAGLQTGVNGGGPIQHFAGNQDINGSVLNAQLGAYGQAASRLDPQWQQRDEQQRAMLVAQGLNPNSAAWQNDMGAFGRDRNDAYNQAIFSAIGAGNAEQNQLFGQQMQQGQFTNAAAQQQFNQNLGQGQFTNAALQQGLQNNNAAQAQQYGQNLSQGQFANAAAGQQYGQGLGAMQAYNQAAGQQFGQGVTAGQFANQAQAQGFGQGLQQGQFTNQAQQQNFAQQQALADYFNQSQLQQGQFANQAAGQQYGQNQGLAQFNNQAQQAQFGQGLQAGQFANQAAGQQFQQGLAAQQAGNAAQQQGFGQAQAQAGFANTAQQQAYEQAMGNANLYNQAGQQAFQQQAYSSQLPINELTALLSAGQVQMPNGVPFSPTQVGGTDVLGAYALNQQQQNANYQAQLQQQQAGLSGLFGLGSAGLSLLAMSDVRTKRDVSRLYTRPDGLGVYAFRYRGVEGWHIGLMAQEVEAVRPDAIANDNGLLLIDYDRLAA